MTEQAVFSQQQQDEGHEIFMGIAKWCGHDSRGLPIPHDDVPMILEKFIEHQSNGRLQGTSKTRFLEVK